MGTKTITRSYNILYGLTWLNWLKYWSDSGVSLNLLLRGGPVTLPAFDSEVLISSPTLCSSPRLDSESAESMYSLDTALAAEGPNSSVGVPTHDACTRRRISAVMNLPLDFTVELRLRPLNGKSIGLILFRDMSALDWFGRSHWFIRSLLRRMSHCKGFYWWAGLVRGRGEMRGMNKLIIINFLIEIKKLTIYQCLHPTACPSSIWGSKNPLNSYSLRCHRTP